MRRNYISPEFTYSGINGTMNMKEETSFLGSKMLYIPNSLSISIENIIYYQTLNNEQINYTIEKNSTPILYSTSSDKLINHTIKYDKSQSQSQYNTNTKWIIEIDILSILTNYIFANLKKYRTFEGVKNNMTLSNNIDTAIKQYISNNILNRYEYDRCDLFISYNLLSQTGQKRYGNTFSEITNSSNILSKVQTQLSSDKSKLTLTFFQEKISSVYNFNYYFNLYFNRL